MKTTARAVFSNSDGVAARVLKNLDVDIEQTRQEILKELDPNFNPQEEPEKVLTRALQLSADHVVLRGLKVVITGTASVIAKAP